MAKQAWPAVVHCEPKASPRDYRKVCKWKLLYTPSDIELATKGASKIAFDTETNGLDPSRSRVVGFSFSTDAHTGYYVPLRHTVGRNASPDCLPTIVKLLREIPVVFMYNKKFDLNMLEIAEKLDVGSARNVYDVMIMVWLRDPDWKSVGMKWATEHFLGFKQIKFGEVVDGDSSFDKVDPEDGCEYAAMDAVFTFMLAADFVSKFGNLKKIFNLDNLAAEAVRRMEHGFIRMDESAVRNELEVTTKRIQELKGKIFNIVGYTFNPNSRGALAEALLGAGIMLTERTGSGAYKTDMETLEAFDHPLTKALSTLSKETKYLGTYVSVAYEQVTGNSPVRFNYRFTNVPTGRYSCGGDKGNDFYMQLNIQSMPKAKAVDAVVVRNPSSVTGWGVVDVPIIHSDSGSVADFPAARLGPEDHYIVEMNSANHGLRNVFLPDDDESVWVSIDYKGQELRIAAGLSGEEVWLDAFRNGKDVHMQTARAVFGDGADKNDRKQSKIINFAGLYGAGNSTLARNMGKSIEETDVYMARYEAGLPNLSRWKKFVQRRAQAGNDMYTYFGRPRRMARYFTALAPASYKAFGMRTAVNTVVQGCLQGHVRILTDHGYVPIKSLYEMDTEGWRVWTGTSWETFDVLNRGKCQLASLHTEDGHRLDCDTRHEVLGHTMKGRSKFYPVKGMRRFKRICAHHPAEIEFVDQDIPRVFRNGKRRNHNFKEVIFPDDLTETFYWLGRYMGDGWIRTDSRPSMTICFGRHEDADAARLVRYFESLGLSPYQRFMENDRGGRTSAVSVESASFVEYYTNILGVVKAGAKEKRTPEIVWSSSLGLRQSYLQGFIDADGYKKRKTLHLSNHELLRETQLIYEISFDSKTRLRGPFKCGSSTMVWDSKSRGSSHLDPDYSYSSFQRLEVEDREEETYTLSVHSPLHRFVSEGIISKNTGADIIKIAFCRLLRWREENPELAKNWNWKITIHDEINFSVRKEWIHEFMRIIPNLMTVEVPDWGISLEVDVSVGKSWGSVIPYEYSPDSGFVPGGHFVSVADCIPM